MAKSMPVRIDQGLAPGAPSGKKPTQQAPKPKAKPMPKKKK